MSHKIAQMGKTMLEMLLVLGMLGIMAVGGVTGIRYGMNLSQSWTAQQQIEELSKGVESLYAWETDYRNVSMAGARGVCENIKLGTQRCDETSFSYASPWGGKVMVTKGSSVSSYKIKYTNVPKSICKNLATMQWKLVFMQNTACSASTQDVIFSAEKSDGTCGAPCPGNQVCQQGQCICINGGLGETCTLTDACKTMNCDGECKNGCTNGRCNQKKNGTSCSGGACYNGECESIVTQPPEVTDECGYACTSKGNVCDQGVCVNPGCTKDKPLANGWGGACNSCNLQHNGYIEVSADRCSVCSNRDLIMGYCVIQCGSDAPLQSASGWCQPCGYEGSVDDPLNKCRFCPNRRRVLYGSEWRCELISTDTATTAPDTTTPATTTPETTTTEDTTTPETTTPETTTPDTTTEETTPATTLGALEMAGECRSYNNTGNVCRAERQTDFYMAMDYCNALGKDMLNQNEAYALGSREPSRYESVWVYYGYAQLAGFGTSVYGSTSGSRYPVCKNRNTSIEYETTAGQTTTETTTDTTTNTTTGTTAWTTTTQETTAPRTTTETTAPRTTTETTAPRTTTETTAPRTTTETTAPRTTTETTAPRTTAQVTTAPQTTMRR